MMNMKRKPSTKNQNRSNNPPSQHMVTLHQRLYQALNLGIKCGDGEGRKWQSTDIEIQKLAARSISAFLSCISPDTLQHPLVKDSVADIVLALVGFTQSRNEVVLQKAAELTVTLVGVLGNSVPFHLLLKLVSSFSCLLSFHQYPVAASCASALNLILSKITPRRLKSHNEIWEILNESNAVDCIMCNLHDFSCRSTTYEYFQVMASLLKTIMLRWPPSRYLVWSNHKFLEGLEAICIRPNTSVEVVVLQLFSAIALCGSGADKLLQMGDTFLSLVLHCTDNSQPFSVRVEAFKLTECLVRSEKRWSRIAKTYAEPIVKSVVDAMGGWNLCSGKVAGDQLPLLAEACKLALVTRWSGEHHIYFWRLKVDRVLLNLLMDNFQGSKQPQTFLSLEEVIATARKGLDANYLGVLRPYIWAILGWLASHCPEDFMPNTHGNNCLHILIACGCLILMDTVHKGRQSSLDVFLRTKLDAAFRAVFLMAHSNCKYIASHARDVLSELSTPDMEVYLGYILSSINANKLGESFSVVNKDQTFMDLIILSSLSALPKYQSFIIQNAGIKILLTFTNWCLCQKADDSSSSQYMSNRSTCCQLDSEDWEGGDTLLFFSLWGLNALIQCSRFVKNPGDLISTQVIGDVNLGVLVVQNLVDKLQEICGSTIYSAGLRWCAAYFCSFFGSYGFPSRLGRKSGEGIHENEFTDIYLKLSSGECLGVHSVILKVRCPSLLPSGDLSSTERMYDLDDEKQCRNFQREVRLSARVEYTPLLKLLEFIYTGFVQVDDNLVKQLRLLAKGCDLHSLSHLLGRKRPKWGTAVPCCDFTLALGPSGCHFSDVILEAKADEVEWTCTTCSLSFPHIHVHKIILWLSCDYFKALFHSGMQESQSQIIKVPVSREALSKLVYWFYSDELSKPSSGCIWTNMGAERQLREVHAYVELCWLAQFWTLEDFREETLRVIVPCLKSSRHLPLEVMKIAFELSQWEIVEVAANCLAPSYPHLRDSGDLVQLNEVLSDMVRVAHVRLSQAGGCGYSD